MGKYFNGESPGMQKFVNAICVKAKGVFENMNPCNVLFGIVQDVDPLTIKIPGDFTLPPPGEKSSDWIVVPTATIPLAIDDNVILLQEQGGRHFVVLGKTNSMYTTPLGHGDILG